MGTSVVHVKCHAVLKNCSNLDINLGSPKGVYGIIDGEYALRQKGQHVAMSSSHNSTSRLAQVMHAAWQQHAVNVAS